MTREEQLSKERDEPESRQESARRMGHAAPNQAKPEPDQQPSDEQQAEEELRKSSGGDPLTQGSD